MKLKEKIEKKLQSVPSPAESELANNKITVGGEYVFSLIIDNQKRFYKMYVPKTFSVADSLPLLFSFHGGGGDMNIQSNDKFYKLISKAEKEKILVVFPNGFSQFPSGEFATWNAGKCCGQARDKKVDDVKFVKEIFNDLKGKIKYDATKVFAIGISNGAMMSYRLACDLPEYFKAIGAVAGTDNTEECSAKKKISIMHIHAKDDDHVLFNGGVGPSAVERDLITEFKSVHQTIEEWKKRNECVGEKILVKDSPSFQCFEYNKCAHAAKLKWCVSETGGHSWPGGEKPRGRKSVANWPLDANEELWNFFETL